METKNQNLNEMIPLIDFKETRQACRCGKSFIYRGINNGTFPRPLKIGARKIAFIRSEVMEWINSRPRIKLQRDPANKEGK